MGQIEGTLGILQNAGAPVNGTNEVQTLTIGGTPTGGTFTLAYEGQITNPITWTDVDNTLIAAMESALRALATIGAGGVTVAAGTLTSGIGTVTLTFGGNLAKLAVPNVSVHANNLAGTNPTVAVAETTPGVTATQRGAAPGALLVDTSNVKLYKNDGTALEPDWNSVGDITEAEIGNGAVTAAKIGTGAVTTTKLGSKAVTGVKLDEASLLYLGFTGNNGAGACTLTGAKMGDKVAGVVNITDGGSASSSFEDTITVVDQIQQSDVGNLSSKSFAVLLVVKS